MLGDSVTFETPSFRQRFVDFVYAAANSFNSCGAYVAPGVWKEFDCYNLAAIGKSTNDDPFTPSWRLIGGYWQWGRKGPDSSQWYDTNTPNFAHGPTGPDLVDANADLIYEWDMSYVPGDAWLDLEKTANDPCPAGYRVPSSSQWIGVFMNNTQTTIGSWSSNTTNYNSARFFGNALMLPAAGVRGDLVYDIQADAFAGGGWLYERGHSGLYHSSSTQYSIYYSDSPLILYFDSSQAYMGYGRYGYSVRCVTE